MLNELSCIFLYFISLSVLTEVFSFQSGSSYLSNGDSDLSSPTSSSSPSHFTTPFSPPSQANGYSLLQPISDASSQYPPLPGEGFHFTGNNSYSVLPNDSLHALLEKDRQYMAREQKHEKGATKGGHNFNKPSLQTVLRAMGKLGLIMGYFFLCDR